MVVMRGRWPYKQLRHQSDISKSPRLIFKLFLSVHRCLKYTDLHHGLCILKAWTATLLQAKGLSAFYQENSFFFPPFFLSFFSFLPFYHTPIVVSGTTWQALDQLLMSHPQGEWLVRTISISQQVGKTTLYLTEIGQLAPNKVKHFSACSRGGERRGGENEKGGNLDFAHLGHAMIFNYPMEGVFYWATRLGTVTCPL